MKLTDNKDAAKAMAGGAQKGIKQDLLQGPKNEKEQLRALIFEKKFAQVVARMQHSPETGMHVASLLKEDNEPVIRAWSALVLADAAKAGVKLHPHQDALASAIGDCEASASNSLHAIKEAVLKDGIGQDFAFSTLFRALSSPNSQVSLSSALNLRFIAEKGVGVPQEVSKELFRIYSTTLFMKSIYGQALSAIAKCELSKALPDIRKAADIIRGDSIQMTEICVKAALDIAHGENKELAVGAKAAIESVHSTLAEGTLAAGYPSPLLAVVEDAISKL